MGRKSTPSCSAQEATGPPGQRAAESLPPPAGAGAAAHDRTCCHKPKYPSLTAGRRRGQVQQSRPPAMQALQRPRCGLLAGRGKPLQQSARRKAACRPAAAQPVANDSPQPEGEREWSTLQVGTAGAAGCTVYSQLEAVCRSPCMLHALADVLPPRHALWACRRCRQQHRMGCSMRSTRCATMAAAS